jgi:catechol 2,3-dioxygenase-like lactoylglutathione lyase family enzyme
MMIVAVDSGVDPSKEDRMGDPNQQLTELHIHHLTLRVTNPEWSARFYEDALGVSVERLEDRCRFKVGQTVVVLREPLPGTPAGDRFSERRIGLDHVSFGVAMAAELERLAQRLRELGAEVGSLEHDPAGGGVGLAFRDPDGIQLEFYADI